MFKEFEECETTIRSWAWKHCPFCETDSKPKSPHGQFGGYQIEIVLQCPICNKSIKFTTDWSPVIEESVVNEYSLEVQNALCPYLSIKKKGDNDYLLRCCSRVRDDCFGKNPENCDCFHLTKVEEYLRTNNLEIAGAEAELAIKLFKQKHPDWVPPNGMRDLVEIKRRTLNKVEWIKWVNNKILELVNVEDFGSAAWIAFSLAEGYGHPEFWQRSSDLFDNYASKLRVNIENERWFRKNRKANEIMYAEIMSLEAQSEINYAEKSALLKRAGDKRHELYNLSGDRFTHPDFLMEAHYFVNYALANPKDAPEYYKKASDFLLSNIEKVEFPREKLYYEGHGKFYLGLYYLSLANLTDDAGRTSFLEKSIEVLDQAISLHKIVDLDTNGVTVIVNCIRAILCAERFPETEDLKLIKEAKEHLEDAKKLCSTQKNIVQVIDALIETYNQALLIVENPKEAILLISRARKRLDDFSQLLPALRIRDIPIENILSSQKYYLTTYLEVIAKNASSYAGRALSFNNICASLSYSRT